MNKPERDIRQPWIFPEAWASAWGDDEWGLHMGWTYKGIESSFRWQEPTFHNIGTWIQERPYLSEEMEAVNGNTPHQWKMSDARKALASIRAERKKTGDLDMLMIPTRAELQILPFLDGRFDDFKTSYDVLHPVISGTHKAVQNDSRLQRTQYGKSVQALYDITVKKEKDEDGLIDTLFNGRSADDIANEMAQQASTSPITPEVFSDYFQMISKRDDIRHKLAWSLVLAQGEGYDEREDNENIDTFRYYFRDKMHKQLESDLIAKLMSFRDENR